MRCTCKVLLVAMAVVAPWASWPAMSAPSVLPHLGNECVGVPQCVAVGGDTRTVAADQSAVVVVVCPDNRPNGWHWDTEQLSHLSVRLVGRTRSALTFNVVNQGDTAGWFSILLGCSPEPFDVTKSGAQSTRTGVRVPLTDASRRTP